MDKYLAAAWKAFYQAIWDLPETRTVSRQNFFIFISSYRTVSVFQEREPSPDTSDRGQTLHTAGKQ